MTGKVLAERSRSKGREQGTTFTDFAYERLKQDISSGLFRPGQPLRLVQLRDQYGFGSTPLREALSRLQTERLVVAAPLRGFSVAPMSVGEMRDTMELRILVERQALQLAMKKGNDAWETQIVGTFHALELHARRLENVSDSPEMEVFSELASRHWAFHYALVSACGSPRLLSLINQLNIETERYRLPVLAGRFSSTVVENIPTEHKRIMDVVLDRDIKATELLADHYRTTANVIEEHMGK